VKAKTGQAKTKVEVEKYYERIESLRSEQEEARSKLQELSAAEPETWKELKASIDEAFTELEKAIERVTSDIAEEQ
jgi:hypothetical protein